ncbi:hypothetical protein Bca52824_073440 [Brassica carinata]|uniref:Uncharacterized protein n=1 Tax=Brassica carinata TaxID=52824 RepID=A0A8X7U7Z7_BRACI|nr:hypothetical protein Bca52824_073440 [Brassica carinata]
MHSQKKTKSVVARMTPTAGIGFAQKTGADNGGESVKHQIRMMERLEQVSALWGQRGWEGAQPKKAVGGCCMTPTAGLTLAQVKTGADNGGEFVEEDPNSGEEARTADKQPQSVDSVETSNMEFQSLWAVGKVVPPKAGVEASVKEIS